MANLTAVFELIDKMSDRLDVIASRGENAVGTWEQAESAADGAFSAATRAADGVATAAGSLGDAVSQATSQTDYWTDAVGNYDKSAMEAIYSTEELVEMGYKTADALEAENQVLEQCEVASTALAKAVEEASETTAGYENVLESANKMSEEIADNDKVSAETKEALQRATESAAQAFEELEEAQAKAQEAMDQYNALMESGTAGLDELEAAANNAAQAAENLDKANDKASQSAEDLGKATEEAGEEAENAGKGGLDAIESISTALATAGITAKVYEIAEAVYGLADAYSEAEKIIVNATGATGDALDSLGASAMAAFATNDDALSDTAAAVGEINTRMGLTGDTLTEVTGLFMDYADITGTNAVTSVQNLTKIMNKWNVEATEVESVMDKVAYAGQISGASVDGLSSTLITGAASFQELGLSLDNAITMLADFELYGISSTTAVTAMRTAVARFSEDGLDAETALRDVITQIAEMENAADATALAVDTFGSRAGVDMVNAIRSGAISIDTFTGSLDAADGTLAKTAEAGESLGEKWEKASNSMNTAFTNAVEPAVSGVSAAFAGLITGIGDFLNKHPTVTKAITAVGVGLGVVVVGVTGVVFVTKVAIPAVTAFGVALNTALGPIGWVALAITGVVAAGTAMVAMMSNAEDETAKLTDVSKQQYYQLQDLNTEYEEACATYGETSEEALRLQYQIDDLTESYEASKQTVEEFTAEVEAMVESHQELVAGYEESMTAINQNEVGTLALIQKLEDLCDVNGDVVGSEQQIKAIVEELNEMLPDLAFSYEDVTQNTEQWVAAIREAAEAQAEEERRIEQQETYIELLKEQANLEEEIAKAEENLRLSREADDNAAFLSDQWFYDKTGWLGMWATNTNEYEDALDELNAAMAENKALIAEIEADYADIANAQQEAANATVSYDDAVTTALESVQAEIDELCEAYDTAYEAARTSIDGQIGLFDHMAAQTELSIADMQAAFDSQIEYLNTYTENLQKAAQYGLDEGLIQSLSDGSEESAGYLNAIIENIEALGEESSEAQAFVDDFNKSFQEVETAKDTFAENVAKMETDFDAKMTEIEGKLNETIEGMNMEADAAEAAKETMAAYTQAIKDGTSGAVSAAQAAASAVASALKTTSTGGVGITIEGNADGTTDAADVFVAGEEGPELIVGAGGSTVFPAAETQKIINAVGGRSSEGVMPDGFYGVGGNTGTTHEETSSTKKVLLEIAGRGNIELTGSGKVDKETMLDFLYEYLKPVLSEIISSELYEEGDYSYEY